MSARSDAVVRHWLGEVSVAAKPFESRWTWLALRRVSPGLGQKLHEQRGLFDEACVTGTIEDVELHGGAMCRGYAVAVRTMTEAGAEDDAYMLGADPESGRKVAIGTQMAALDRVREIHGQDVLWITPDEVAVLMASVEAFKFVGVVRQFFPGSEVVKRYAEAGS
jgi:hypothetical protein